MTDADVIVAGGGAAGLVAAMELSRAGKKVILLEARDRLGGRIHTLEASSFDVPAEAGAEFIHGNLPVTIGLLEEAGIAYHAIAGDLWQFMHGKWNREDDFMEGGDLLAERLHALQEDITVADFLERNFNGEQYTDLRDSIRRYVEGYDSGNIQQASTFALRDEWLEQDMDTQYRVDGGYIRLVRYLAETSAAAGCRIYLDTIVQHIQWQPGHVEVTASGNKRYTAKQLLVTVPLGILQAQPGEEGAITFSPGLPEQMAAIRDLGFGSIIKILLQFKDAFWKDAALHKRIGGDISNAGWIFSNAPVPTWWTQLPDQSALLTGWLGGPKARQLQHTDDNSILSEAIATLSLFFNLPPEALYEKLAASRIFNWQAEPFTRGAYAYSTCHTSTAIPVLERPVANTLFFAGEALHNGPQMGTVEGALASGKKAAGAVISSQ